MNRELLEKPFEPEQIKQLEGNFGKMLDNIEGHAVTQRLNDARYVVTMLIMVLKMLV